MSLILEALRKSEAERRRGQAPDIHRELPLAVASTRLGPPSWLGWSGAAVVVSVLLFVAWHRWPARAPTPSVPAGIESDRHEAARATLPPVARLSPVDQVPGQPAPMPAASASTAAPGASAPARVVAPAPPPPVAAGRDTPMPSPTPAQPASPANTIDDTIALSDLSIGERKALPPLKLSMHLWNADSSRRFVIIDGNRLREGDRAGDAVVTAITEDGVILDWNGRRIRLSIR
jgi:general secretion pathway protein B